MKARAKKLALLLSVTMVLGSVDTGMAVMAQENMEAAIEEEVFSEEDTTDVETEATGEDLIEEREEQSVENQEEQVLTEEAADVAVQNVDTENQVAVYSDDEEVRWDIPDDEISERTIKVGESCTMKTDVYNPYNVQVSYQWYVCEKNLWGSGETIEGANSEEYTFVQKDDITRTYYCVVTDGKTKKYSKTFFIEGTYNYETMDWELVGTSDSEKWRYEYGVDAKLGQEIEFGVKDVTTTLGTKISYQWYKVNEDNSLETIPGATGATYKLKMGCTAPTSYQLWMTDGKTIIKKPYYINVENNTDKKHSFPEEWTVRTAATYTNEGIAYRTCSKCGAEETKTLEKLVKPVIPTTKISNVPSSVKLTVGGKKTLSPVITPKDTTDKITYTSSNSKVATVSGKGVITAKKAGTTTITVKSGNKSVKAKITVTPKVATGISGVPGSKTLKKGKNFTIKAKVTPNGASGKITYKSSNKKVATVNAKGKVTAKKKGKAVITVTVGKIKKTCKVTVK